MTKRSSDDALKAAEQFAEKHDPDPGHARQVRRNALALFDATKSLHGLGKRERVLLEAAALMHDVGYRNRPEKHHKGSRDLILASALEGFPTRSLMIIACVARYHRGALPSKEHAVYCELAAKDQAIVDRLAALLRVTDGLDRSHSASLESLRIEFDGETARLFVRQNAQNETDLWGGRKKRDLFETVFGVTLEIVEEQNEGSSPDELKDEA